MKSSGKLLHTNVTFFWLIWFINQGTLYNHALPVVVVGIVGIDNDVIAVYSPRHMFRHEIHIWCTHVRMSLICTSNI